MNDLDLCLEVVSRSCQPYIVTFDVDLNIWETIRDRGLVPKDHRGNGIWAIKWSRDQ